MPISNPHYASFGRRLLAHSLDLIFFTAIIAAVAFVLVFPMLLLGFFAGASTLTITLFALTVWLGGAALFFTLHWLYFAGFECSPFMGTPGKLLTKLKVCDETGSRLTPGQATIRYLGRYLSTLLCFFGFLMALFTSKKQALHDLLSHSIVLQTNPETSISRQWQTRNKLTQP